MRNKQVASNPAVPRPEHVSRFARIVDIERIIECPFSLALDDIDSFLPMLDTQAVLVHLPYRLLGIPLDGAIKHRVKAHFHRQRDRTEQGRAHDELDFKWCAQSRWLPDLQGVLRIRIAGVDARILLHAQYEPPFGMLGSLFDRSIGQHLALATANNLLDRFAVTLQHRWTQELKRYPDDRSTLVR